MKLDVAINLFCNTLWFAFIFATIMHRIRWKIWPGWVYWIVKKLK